MSKKNIITLTVALLAVAGLYCYLYRDSFRATRIQISHTIRPRAWALTHREPNAAPNDPLNLVIFRLDHPYKLTSVKVISVPELETNKYARPVWELTSDSNSIAIPAFPYGMRIRGMRSAVKGAQPGELTPNVPYRLFVQAGSIKGEHDFTVTDENRLAH